MQGLAGEREVGLAERLVLGGVGVHERGDVVGVRLPVVDELGLADQLADPVADQVDADDRAVLAADQLDEALGLEDLALAVAAEVVGQRLDAVGAVLLARPRPRRGRPRRSRGGSRSPAGCRPRRSAPGRARRCPRRRRCPAGSRGGPAGGRARCRRRRRRPRRWCGTARRRARTRGPSRRPARRSRGRRSTGPRPTATSSSSASITSPPSTVTATPVSVVLTLWNGVPVRKLILRLRKARSSAFDDASSSAATSRGSASMMVTSAPKLLPHARELAADHAAAEHDRPTPAPGRAGARARR